MVDGGGARLPKTQQRQRLAAALPGTGGAQVHLGIGPGAATVHPRIGPGAAPVHAGSGADNAPAVLPDSGSAHLKARPGRPSQPGAQRARCPWQGVSPADRLLTSCMYMKRWYMKMKRL